MARIKEAPYHLRSKNGRAYILYTTPAGTQKGYLGLPYDPERSGPEERRAAEQAAERRWRELTDGRTLDAADRVRTDSTFSELYTAYLRQWQAPADASPNDARHLATALVVRRAYGGHLADWAGDGAKRPDGSPRWRGDKRTPLERVVADEGPGDFLASRLLKVQRKTMRKEKSNLVQFLAWCKAAGYLASVPPVVLPAGRGVAHPQMKRSGRGMHIPMTPLDAAKIVTALPEWSSRKARNGGDRFLVRPFFDFMRLTGLREATIERLEVPRNWRRAAKALKLDDADDKARYGRVLPLLPDAVALLERYAPERGHIFGHHDFRKHIRAAAKIVFADRPEIAERFGGYHFRHFVATLLANLAGTNLVGAQYVLGHLDLGTTSGYVHADEAAARDVLAKAAGVMKKATKQATAWAKKREKEARA